MVEYMEIGPVPCNEPCAQVGQDNYRQEAKKEMQAYIYQLHRAFPDAYDNNIDFVMKWYQHDFGTYGEVCIQFFTDDENAVAMAYEIESHLPEDWDTEARKELNLQ